MQTDWIEVSIISWQSVFDIDCEPNVDMTYDYYIDADKLEVILDILWDKLYEY